MTSRRTRDRLVERLCEEGIRDPAVLEAIRDVPRHVFVDEALASRAYENTALPIGCGQTISQPYIVARMTEALSAGVKLGPVLEVGSGCGYQSAVLARVAANVYSVERIASLLFRAREKLHELRVGNVRLRHGDGTLGWSEHAPFDGILVTAAPIGVPDQLLEQLAPRGRLVIPVGSRRHQKLLVIERTERGFEQSELEEVKFVPMLRGTG